MSVFDRIWSAGTRQIELHGDVKRALARLDKVSENVFDHEKRLVRLETLVEVARGGFDRPRLPPE